MSMFTDTSSGSAPIERCVQDHGAKVVHWTSASANNRYMYGTKFGQEKQP